MRTKYSGIGNFTSPICTRYTEIVTIYIADMHEI